LRVSYPIQQQPSIVSAQINDSRETLCECLATGGLHILAPFNFLSSTTFVCRSCELPIRELLYHRSGQGSEVLSNYKTLEILIRLLRNNFINNNNNNNNNKYGDQAKYFMLVSGTDESL
jgi:hypothetical protein